MSSEQEDQSEEEAGRALTMGRSDGGWKSGGDGGRRRGGEGGESSGRSERVEINLKERKEDGDDGQMSARAHGRGAV